MRLLRVRKNVTRIVGPSVVEKKYKYLLEFARHTVLNLL